VIGCPRLDLISNDAGMTSAANAKHTNALGLGYLSSSLGAVRQALTARARAATLRGVLRLNCAHWPPRPGADRSVLPGASHVGLVTAKADCRVGSRIAAAALAATTLVGVACTGREGLDFGQASRSHARRAAATSIAAGTDVTCEVQSDGRVLCWGADSGGEGGKLGDGPADGTPGPVVVLGITDAVAVATTGWTSCAVRATGAVMCWGNDWGAGVLGDGTGASSSFPVRVLGVDDAVSVALSGSYDNGFACAVRARGGVRCWGTCDTGGLGDGRLGSGCGPQLAVDVRGLSDVIELAAAVNIGSMCARTGAGELFCWGDGVASPTRVAGLQGVTDIAVGTRHFVALLADGTLWAWGNCSTGACGDGAYDWPNTPKPVLGIADAVAVVAGNGWSCAQRANGELSCWGSATYNIDLTRHLSTHNVPQSQSILTGVRQLAAGMDHACARTAGGLLCWGLNADGQSGPATLDYDTKAHLAPLAAHPTHLVANGFATCGIDNGRALCWGGNPYGSLGDRSEEPALGAVAAVFGVDDAVRVGLGEHFGCVRRASGDVLCFGRNNVGQLGDGSTTESLLSRRVVGGATDLTLGLRHACAVRSDSRVVCWGDNASLQLGSAGIGESSTPIPVSGLTAALAVVAGTAHTCALLVDRTVRCWGAGGAGELGDGQTQASAQPVAVAGLTNVTQLAAGASMTCAIVTSGELWCWGNGYGFRFLNNNHDPQLTPVRIPVTPPVLALGLGLNHTCAELSDGTVECWGLSDHGQCGLEAYWTAAAIHIAAADGATELSSGVAAQHTCAATSGGMVCWGNNRYGQLADGVDNYSPRLIGGLE